MSNIRFGIIGCGSISKFHFNGIEKAGAKVTYIADLNEDAAKPWLQKTGAKFTKNYIDLINSPDVDVVSILSSSPFHKDMALAALSAGKDVVCEKTMTVSSKEAEEIVLAAKKSEKLFYTTYMKRFFPAVVKGKELFPQIGRIISAHVRSYQPWSHDFYNRTDLGWATNIVKNCGGALLPCAGSHMLDMTMNFLGRPEYVYAKVDYCGETNFDRKTTAILEYENGSTATFETLANTLDNVGYERNGWDEKIEINGVDGRIEIFTVMWDHSENNGALLVHYDNKTKTSTEYRFDAVNPFYIEIFEVVKSIENRKQIQPNVIDGFNVDVLIEAMYTSSKLKKAIKLDWKGF